MNKNEEICLKWYQKSYTESKFDAQRRYPNEEILRFLGREFFSKVKPADRENIKVLELGCGSCANLWMVAKEGFDTYGIDISPKAIELGRLMLEKWEVDAKLTTGTITDLPYEDNYFDVVFDIFAIYTLCENDFRICLNEINRTLKPGGKFFSYSPSTNSDAFKDYEPSKKLDEFTLDGIRRKTSPYYGNIFPFRFTSPGRCQKFLEEAGFKVTYLETVSRTYRRMKETFELVVIAGEKK